MKDWPGGSYAVMVSDDLVATGYIYYSKKVICFLSSKNFESTKPGEPYEARFVDEFENTKLRKVLRPR